MRNIEDIIYEEYAYTNVKSDKEYVALQENLVKTEEELFQSLNAEQKAKFRNFQDASDSLEVYNDVRIVGFVLDFLRQLFNKPKRKG